MKHKVFYKHFCYNNNDFFDLTFLQFYRDALKRKQIDIYQGLESSFKGNVEFCSAITVCYIEDSKRKEIARGYAFCGPDDKFCKKIGREISFTRAIRELFSLKNISCLEEKLF